MFAALECFRGISLTMLGDKGASAPLIFNSFQHRLTRISFVKINIYQHICRIYDTYSRCLSIYIYTQAYVYIYIYMCVWTSCLFKSPLSVHFEYLFAHSSGQAIWDPPEWLAATPRAECRQSTPALCCQQRQSLHCRGKLSGSMWYNLW
jgi:hypothetical protein